MTTTETAHPFPSVTTAATPLVAASQDSSISALVYETCRRLAGRRLTTDDIASHLRGQVSLQQVRGALINMGKAPDAYPYLHRVERGIYVFDEREPRMWYANPNNARGSRKAAAKRRRNARTTTEQRPSIVQAKQPTERPVVPSGELRLVEDAVVMTDPKGNLFIVRLTPV